jgi:hypothetical protein
VALREGLDAMVNTGAAARRVEPSAKMDRTRSTSSETRSISTSLRPPDEYARLAVAIIENPMLNGGTIRLDAGQRFAPK